jgi:hypothetical protein
MKENVIRDDSLFVIRYSLFVIRYSLFVIHSHSHSHSHIKKPQPFDRGFHYFLNSRYPFIDSRNSSLFRVPFILLNRNSIASFEFISLINLRRIQTR